MKCDQKLIQIGDSFYVLHTTITCVDTKIKQELEFNDDRIGDAFIEKSENLEIDKGDETLENKIEDLLIDEEIEADVAEAISVGDLSVQEIKPAKSLKKPKLSKPVKHATKPKRKRGRPRKCCENAEQSNEGDSNPTLNDDSDINSKEVLEIVSPVVTKPKGERPKRKETFFKCEHKGCDKIVRNRNRLAHLRTHQKERFECDICHASLASKTGLRAHFDVHYPRREFKCQICPAEYKSLSSLNQHVRYVHENEPKQFICTICGSAQRKRHLLLEHMNRHNGIKPYTCPYDGCEMRFFSKARRSEHSRTHTGEKPYCCSVDGCDTRFAYAIDFKRHRFRAHGIFTNKYNCSICTEVFPENRLLKKHMKAHHKQIG